MGIYIACDWCRQPIRPGDPYVTVTVEGSIIEGHRSNERQDVGGPARVYCALDRYDDDDLAAHGLTIGNEHHSHRPSCAQRMLAALNGDPFDRADRGLEWRLVAQVAPGDKFLVDAPIEALEMSGRTRAALKKAGVESVKELARMTEAEWWAIRGISEDRVAEIRIALNRHREADPKQLAERIKTGVTA